MDESGGKAEGASSHPHQVIYSWKRPRLEHGSGTALAAGGSLGAVICTSKNKLIVIFHLHKGKGREEEGGWECEGNVLPTPSGWALPKHRLIPCSCGAHPACLVAEVEIYGNDGTGPSSSSPQSEPTSRGVKHKKVQHNRRERTTTSISWMGAKTCWVRTDLRDGWRFIWSFHFGCGVWIQKKGWGIQSRNGLGWKGTERSSSSYF